MAHATVLLDPRLDIASEGKSSIFKGPRTQQYQIYKSVSTTAATTPNLSHTISGSLQPDTLLASRVRVKGDLVFQPSYTLQNTVTTGIVTPSCAGLVYGSGQVPFTLTVSGVLTYTGNIFVQVVPNSGGPGGPPVLFQFTGPLSVTVPDLQFYALTLCSFNITVENNDLAVGTPCYGFFNITGGVTSGPITTLSSPPDNAIVAGNNIPVNVVLFTASGQTVDINAFDVQTGYQYTTCQVQIPPGGSSSPSPVPFNIDTRPQGGGTRKIALIVSPPGGSTAYRSGVSQVVSYTYVPGQNTPTVTPGPSNLVASVMSAFPRDASVTQWPLHSQLSSMDLSLGQVTSSYQAMDFPLYARLARAVERRSETCSALPGTSLINLNGGASAVGTAYRASNRRGFAFGDPNGDGYWSGGLGDLVPANSATTPLYWCNLAGNLPGTSGFVASYGPPSTTGAYTITIGPPSALYSWELAPVPLGAPIQGAVGQWALTFTALGTDPLPVGTVITSPFYVGMRSTETLKMSPFCIEALSNSKTPALPHIATFTLKSQFFTDGRCNALLPTSGYNNFEVGSAIRNLTFVSCPRMEVHCEFIGSATSVAIPSLAFAPWIDIQRYISPPVGPTITTSSGISSLATLPGGLMRVEVLCPPLAYVPDYLFVRMTLSDETLAALRVGGQPVQRNVASLPIYAINVKLENAVWGTQVSQERLYEMTVKNGYDVPWDVFTGLGAGTGPPPTAAPGTIVTPKFIANPGPNTLPSTWPHSTIATLGSGLLLTFGKDIQLAPNSSPGVAKPLRVSLIVSYYSTIPSTYTILNPATTNSAIATPVLMPTTVGGLTPTILGQAVLQAHFLTHQQMISSPGTNRIHTSSVLPATVEVARPNFLNISAGVPDDCETLANPGAAFAAVQNDQYAGSASFGGILSAAAGPGVAAPAVWGPG